MTTLSVILHLSYCSMWNQGKWMTEYLKLQILTVKEVMSGTERPHFPDLTMGRSTFKRAAVEDMGGNRGNYCKRVRGYRTKLWLFLF